MYGQYNNPVKAINGIAAALAVTVALVLPTGYFALNHQNAVADMRADAENLSEIVGRLILQNPDTWKFMSHLEDLLRRSLPHKEGVAHLVDKQNVVIAKSAASADWPVMQVMMPAYDAGLPVATVIVERSMRPLLSGTAIAALLGALLGVAIFVVLRMFPLRTLGRVLSELQAARNDAEHKAHTLEAYQRELESKVSERTTELRLVNNALEIAREASESRAAQLEQGNREMTLISQMLELLQISHSLQEAEHVIAQGMGGLFPGDSGTLYLFTDSRSALEAAAQWGAVEQTAVCMPDQCWAVRRGQVHKVEPGCSAPRCAHVLNDAKGYVCLPLMAQGEMLGILHLQWGESVAENSAIGERSKLALQLTNQLGLAISNLKLRDTLKSLSIRDPLTGLFNRRYMEETLEREFYQARRKKSPVAVIMLDVDHFKRLNDTFGHNAGDIVLRELGTLIKRSIRVSDIACRYGGEEFCVILPDSDLVATRDRAEVIRQAVTRIDVKPDGRVLGPITISLGIALFPDHAETIQGVLAAADASLYLAKQGGRDRICVFKTAG